MTTRSEPQGRRQRRLIELEARRSAPRRAAPRRGLSLGMMSGLAVLGGVLVIVLAIVLNGGTQAADGPELRLAFAPSTLTSDGYVLGAKDAPVTIELYEDFQCPACRSWGQSVFPSLVSNELAAGTAKIVFRDLAFLGPESFVAAHAAYAAGQQGRFWDMWATIYANQGHENHGSLSSENLAAMASALRLDAARFAADMNSAAARSSVEASNAAAHAAGVESTPTIIVDGRLMVGATYPDIAAAIAAAR